MNQPLKKGLTITEVMAAMALMGVMTVVIAQIMTLSNVSKQLIQQRVLAQQELSNLAQQVTMTPYEKLDEQWAAKQTLGEDHPMALQGAQLSIDVQTIESPKTGKRIELKIQWPQKTRGSYQLACWKFAPPATEETP
ncbi:MAG: PilW family protein [Pirellulales bacterium]|jgi:prepilin-type N-terminal cleavage/methylation domain-containing protein